MSASFPLDVRGSRPHAGSWSLTFNSAARARDFVAGALRCARGDAAAGRLRLAAHSLHTARAVAEAMGDAELLADVQAVWREVL